MQVFSFHLVKTSPATTIKAMGNPLGLSQVPGLCHAECMMAMTLGAPIVSLERMKLGTFVLFAAWKNDTALDVFLADNKLGRTLSEGWYVRLKLIRRWGQFSGLDDFREHADKRDPNRSVVAVTLARLKLPHVYRFIHWGKPVEEQVRDHPGAVLALAATRPPRTFSTFSVWRSQQEMEDMVHGRGSAPTAERHAAAMAERNRKDFHHEFTTLRFRTIEEQGVWGGKSGIVPK